MKRREFLRNLGITSVSSLAPRSLQSKARAQGTIRTSQVVVGGSTGFGLSYLPLTWMEHQALFEKHATANGLKATMRFQRFSTAAPMYDALLSGEIQFASGGVTQLLTSWEKTRTSVKIRGVGALNSMPLALVTSNPRIETVKDFGSRDRIALPAVRTSIEAVVLAMATEKALGEKQGDKLNPITVSLGHSEAMAALLDGNSGIDAHFASAPFMYQELAVPGIRKVIDSYEVLGGPHTHNALWTTTNFHNENRDLAAVFTRALLESLDQIRRKPAAAASFYLEVDNVKGLSATQMEEIIRKSVNEWTMVPRKFMQFARYMSRRGLLATPPTTWRELFFESAHNMPGD